MSGRRLRFPLEVGARESIPGVVARGVRQHVLVRTAPVLEAAGVDIRHLGLSQIATPEELERLAFVARCPANELVRRAGVRLVERGDEKSYDAAFGRLIIPRAYLEFNRRRIGPGTLAGEGYHRASWMNLLVPYCPESLERLVDRCDHCDTPLGWFHSHGIGYCDRCALQVGPSTEAPLPEPLADDYRLFASLSSPDTRGVEAACMLMPATLDDISPGSLVRLALLLGGLMQPTYVPTLSRHGVTRLPTPTLAAVVTTGTAALRSWPDGFRTWVTRQAEELSDSPADLETLRARMKRLADRNAEAEDVVRTVTDAMPDLHRHAAHGFAVNHPYYLYKPVQNMLGLSSPSMDVLKKWSGIIFRKLNTGRKEQGQFDVAQIDALVPVFRDSLRVGGCAESMALPHYAVEQLCAAGLLEWENHPVLLGTATTMKVRGVSLRRLAAELAGKARGVDDSTEAWPADLVSLASASRRIGGRLKPWASIIGALCAGSVPFWMDGRVPTTTSIQVRAKDLARFDAVVDADAPPGFAVAHAVSQRDAAEILNIAPKYMPELGLALDFPFLRKGQMLVAERAAVVAAVARVAWSAEIALHMGLHHRSVEDELSARGINALPSGWPRERLILEGILPHAPTF
ncbi:hypothetical protein HMP06_0891 [Sphingomonas sp. HMP6]|nr:hypothetical protein HMP06_0891 [Sphingomonas sp. HMP6]